MRAGELFLLCVTNYHRIFVVMKPADSSKQIIERTVALVRGALADMRLNPGATVIVALSGGADSVALLSVLADLGYDCRAAHCNFHLRGEESMRDMRHVQTLCRDLGVELYIRDFDVPAQMAAAGESVEMACRTLRYRWFDELLDRERASAIAVGHHREDRAETFMLNLMRGAGLDGLTSMRPVEGSVVRPLLALSRGEIESYLSARGLSYVTDSTNAENAYRRNSIRNRVFPLLAEIFGPGVLDAVVRTVGNLERSRAVYSEALQSKLARYYDGVSTIDIAAMVANECQPALVLFEILRDKHFNFSQADDIIARAASSGIEFRSTDGATVAELSHGRLVLTDAARVVLADKSHCVDISHDIESPVCIRVETLPVAAFAPGADPCHAYFDADVALAPHSWEILHYRRGDRMVPFGARRSKLISDIFANAKYEAAAKRQAWFLLCDGEIVWAPALKNSAFAPVGPETRRFLHLQYIPK